MAPTSLSLASVERRELFWFFAVALLVLGAGFGLRDPWPADEPRFVLVAKQMVDSGQWLFPHRGIELYADKPPLYFWLLAACHRLIGSWRWSFLLPSLLAGLGTLWLVQDLGRRLWNHRAGLLAAIAVLSALQFAYQFKRAQIDPTLVAVTTLSFYALCRHVLLGDGWRWYWLACFAAGIGVILKGVGFLPLFALLPYALMRRRGWQGLAPLGSANHWRWLVGLAAMLAAVALWLVPMVLVALAGGDPEHRAYLDNLLFKQTATRYTEAWHHLQPAWYFLAVIALFWLPLSLAFPWLARDWREAWRQRDARVWLPLSWGLLVLVFFSASPGKRDMYILPALPAFALAAAPFLDGLLQRDSFLRALRGFSILLGALLFGVGLAALIGSPGFVQKLVLERGLGPEVRWLWLMLALVGALGLLASLLPGRRGALVGTALLLIGVWCGYGFVAHPVLDPSSSSSALMRQARRIAGPDRQIGLVQWKEQNLLQAVGPTTEFGFRQPAAEQLRRAVAWLDADPDHRRVMFSQPRDKPGCLSGMARHAQLLGVANRRNWYLADRAAISSQCFGGGLVDPTP